jgi:hypothetical protein
MESGCVILHGIARLENVVTRLSVQGSSQRPQADWIGSTEG